MIPVSLVSFVIQPLLLWLKTSVLEASAGHQIVPTIDMRPELCQPKAALIGNSCFRLSLDNFNLRADFSSDPQLDYGCLCRMMWLTKETPY